jgi:predicted Rossmann fold flavoprotein
LDLAIIGAGAAGLAAAIFAGASSRSSSLSIILLDGAKKPGAKILVSGGGRCNVTHDVVRPEDFWGGSRAVVKRVLKSFDEKATVRWMQSLGVMLKTEETGKLFPVSDSARTVLGALINQVRELGIPFVYPARVARIEPTTEGFRIDFAEEHEPLHARRVIVATGGLSLPKSGSDGWGISELRRLGHSIVPTTSALSPLVLEPSEEPGGQFAELAGLTLDGSLTLREPSGKSVVVIRGSLLFTHFGLSGPAALDFSRHWLRWTLDNEGSEPVVQLGLTRFQTVEAADEWLTKQAAHSPRKQVANVLGDELPSRIARLVCPEGITFSNLAKTERRRLAQHMAAMPIRILRDRGYSFAETTAGGVDLSEVDPNTFESRKVPGLHVIGEMLDVDGRIGGFNFQWAWATGFLAGRAAVKQLIPAS